MVSPLPQLRRVRQFVERRVPNRYRLVRKELDRLVQFPVLDRLLAPFVESFDGTRDPFPTVVFGVSLVGRFTSLHLRAPLGVEYLSQM